MTDGRLAYDDQLPWLEPVDDEDEPRGISARKMLAWLVIVLVAAAIISGTFFWLGRQRAAESGAPELIKAEPGPYKVRPSDPGGLDVAGESETAFQTGAGQDTDAQLDLNAAGGAPVSAPPKEKPRPLPGNETREPVPDEPAPQAAPAAGSAIQLGAFANRAQAERAWTALSARFPSVGAMTKMIVPFPGGIRLRASAGSSAEAGQACQMLKAAGENCFVAN